MMDDHLEKLSTLRNLLDRQFNTAGLRTLCFDLEVDYDNLAGETKWTRFESLLRILGPAGRGPHLIQLAQDEYPHLSWPEINWDLIDWGKWVEEKGHPVINMTASGAYFAGQVNVQGGIFAGRDYVEKQIIVQGTAIESLEDLPPEPGEPPFKGLEFFSQEDAHLFFGRDRLIAKLVNKLRETNLHAVVGASGSGKSSLARAGVLPIFTEDRELPGVYPPAGRWQPRILTPTASPLDALARAFFPTQTLATIRQSYRNAFDTSEQALLEVMDWLLKESGFQTILVVDQFEELFTLCKNDSDRQIFIDLLFSTVAASSSTHKIIITLRADFYPECLRYEKLKSLLENQQTPVTGMKREELRSMIIKPAGLGGWQIQQGLVELMLDDVGSEPGGLPLLSHALLETWRNRRGRVMTLSGYKEAGGVKGAIAQTAEKVYTNADKTQKDLIKRIFLELTELGEGAQDTRRRIPKKELKQRLDSQQIHLILAKLTDPNIRLITSSLDTENSDAPEEFLEVAHEALIREWPRLREWLDENRDDLRFLRRLKYDVQEWHQNAQDEGFLYSGVELARLEAWLSDNETQLSPLERSFIETSLRKREKQEAEEEEKRLTAERLAAQERFGRTLRLSIGIITLLFFAAVAATIFTINSRREIERLKTSIRASQLAEASRAEINNDPELALLLATAGLGLNRQPDTEARFYDAIFSPFHTSFYAHTDQLLSVDFNKNGTRILTSSLDGSARVWDLTGKELTVYFDEVSWINSAEFHPDGKQVLTTGINGSFTLWDEFGNKVRVFNGHPVRIYSAEFSKDGDYIISNGCDIANDTEFSCRDSSTRLWNLSGDELVILKSNQNLISYGKLDDKNDLILTAYENGTISLWDLNGNWLIDLEGHSYGIISADFGPNSQLILTTSLDGTVRLWDTKNGWERIVFEDPFVDYKVAEFSPNGKMIVTADNNGVIKVWDLSGDEILRFESSALEISSVYFSPDNQQILSYGCQSLNRFGGCDIGLAELWDMTGKEALRLVGHRGVINDAAFSPDGEWIATASSDKSARLWNLIGAISVSLHNPTFHFTSALFSPDGQMILTTGDDRTARLWDLSGQELALLEGHEELINSALFHPTGQKILTGSRDGTARLWDLFGNELIRFEGHPYEVKSVAFSPDGQSILTAGCDKIDEYFNCLSGTARLWTYNGNEITSLNGHSSLVYSALFSPDGEKIATASIDGTARLWDLSGNELALLSEHSSAIWIAEFSPDGQQIFTGGDDGIGRLWTSRGEHLFTLDNRPGRILFATFSQNSQYIITTTDNGTVRLWDKSGNLLFERHIDNYSDIWGAAFSPDGDQIAIPGPDFSLRLWNLFGEEIVAIDSTSSIKHSVAFSSDGKRIITVSNEDVRVWPTYALFPDIAKKKIKRGFYFFECERFFRDEFDQCPQSVDELLTLFDVDE